MENCLRVLDAQEMIGLINAGPFGFIQYRRDGAVSGINEQFMSMVGLDEIPSDISGIPSLEQGGYDEWMRQTAIIGQASRMYAGLQIPGKPNPVADRNNAYLLLQAIPDEDRSVVFALDSTDLEWFRRENTGVKTRYNNDKMEQSLDALKDSVGYDFGFVAFKAPNDSFYQLGASRGLNDEQRSRVKVSLMNGLGSRYSSLTGPDISGVDANIVCGTESGSILTYPIINFGKVIGAIVLGSTGRRFDQGDIEHVKVPANYVESHLQLLEVSGSTICSFMGMLEIANHMNLGHPRRVSDIAGGMGSEIGFSDDQMRCLRNSAMVHDIGKMLVPSELIRTKGRYGALERAMMEFHPELGAQKLCMIPGLKRVGVVVSQHHENYDGTGYARGLEGREILPESRVIRIADSFDVMVNGRNYKDSRSAIDAVDDIKRHSGTWYDPGFVQVLEYLVKSKIIRSERERPQLRVVNF
ncbi:HD domain-containing protein [Candidatus Woesearchaeota archaeon]|nr:HD domain-containing protein [Candidatus Woesearchaeota archaeon]